MQKKGKKITPDMVLPVRCSALPRFCMCPSGTLEGAYSINAGSDAAKLGSAAHEAAAQMINGQEIEIDAIANHHGISVDDLERLVSFAQSAWADLSSYAPKPRTEIKMSSDVVSGTADVVSSTEDEAFVLDWKTGFKRADYTWQLAGYAYLVRAKFGMPRSGKITSAIVFLRHGEFEVRHWTDEALDEFQEAVRGLSLQAGRTYNPGEHCGYCPSAYICEARADHARAGASLLAEVGKKELSRGELGALYEKSRFVKKVLSEYETALKAELAGGPIDLEDGAQLQLVDINRQTIDAKKSWPVLRSFEFSQDEISSCLLVTKSKILAIAGDKAERGAKQKYRAELLSKLNEAGAVSVKTAQKIERTKGTGNE